MEMKNISETTNNNNDNNDNNEKAFGRVCVCVCACLYDQVYRMEHVAN